ncbi:putative bifunctional lysylphosphatidylglycerol flippase/synthetase [Halalkalicoccus jeotgali]|uniref:Uncharacterized protein n=1 Tax=Halalkalicoccus jeotgali (strain DSM 18796 / CECT 7217 / JCM 14584 / KCTC 4019 / B3) TaxID=795797 RepID=D8J3H1_HALJB|nr:lysylphosphatidylglycerol synthetase family protein [Halalkalicoccus jeotgali]ADJ15278.1 hypothetical protein HacjB3_09475 [Halalkalicoccus jeotgali B3]ELY35301.1 hypothetical protein C497_13201 [Halalkalicoccus jeotgali B3]
MRDSPLLRSALTVLKVLFALVVFGVALVALYREFRLVSPEGFLHGVEAYSPVVLVGAVGLTAATYATLIGFDVLGFRYIERPHAIRRVALPSFVSLAVSNNVGISFVVGGSIRYRIYATFGVSAGDAARIVAFSFVANWLGFFALFGPLVLVDPTVIEPAGVGDGRVLGVALLALVAGYVFISGRWDAIGRGRIRMVVPSRRFAIGQLLLGACNWLFTSAILLVFLSPSLSEVTTVLAAILGAQFVGAVAPVPGGLGALEATFLALRPDSIPLPTAVLALLVYRLFYYLLPLAVAVVIVGVRLGIDRRSNEIGDLNAFGTWAAQTVPDLLAGVTTVAGAILVLVGVLPDGVTRLAPLDRLLPLSVVEASHLVSILLGVGLLVLARGLQLRLRRAHTWTVVLLTAGAALSMLRRGDYAVAIVFTGVLLSVVPARAHFSDRLRPDDTWITPEWLATVAIVAAAALWLGIVVYQSPSVADQLGALPPRAVRRLGAVVLAVLAIACVVLWRIALRGGRSADRTRRPR